MNIVNNEIFDGITGAKEAVISDGKIISAITGRQIGTVNGEISGGGGSGSIELPSTNFTAADLRKNKTAVDGEGNLVTGSMPDVALSRSVNVVSIGKGYSAGGSITINKVSLEKEGNTVSIQEGYTTGGSVEVSIEVPTLPSVNITPEALRNGVTAIDSNGNKVTGTMQDTTFTNKAITVNYSTGAAEFEATSNKGYWNGTTLEYQQTLPVAKATAEGLKVTFTQGVISAGSVSVTLPSVNVAAANMLKGTTALNSAGEVVQGSIDNGSISTPSASYDPTDNVFNIIVSGSKGYYASKIEEEFSVSADINAAEVNETDTSVTVGTGYVFEELTFEKGGSGGNGSFVKVTNFIAPHDAYTAVTAINVSGFGLHYNEDWGEEQDLSEYNGVYAVTPATANEQELTDRVFKHPTEEMYIFFGQETEIGEGECWFFSSSTDNTSAYGALAYKSGKELPNGQATWYKVYSDSPVLTTTHVTTEVPAQPLVLSGATATLENGAWTIGSAVTLSGYDKTPLKHGIYMVSDNKLIGDAIAYHANMYMPTDGLLMYFPMDGGANGIVDVVGGMRLTAIGKGILDSNGSLWNTGGQGSIVGFQNNFNLPKSFTLSAKINYTGKRGDNVIDFGLREQGTGFGIRCSRIESAQTVSYGLRIGYEESPRNIKNVPWNEDHLITMTFDSTTKKHRCYLDGVFKEQHSRGEEVNDAKNIEIFGRYIQFNYIDGSSMCKVSEVMLWDRVLSDSEIMQLNRDLA
jgi:hypothetical protein